MIHRFKLIAFILILLAIPLTVILAGRVQNFINQASVVDRKLIMGISLPGGNAAQEGRETQTLAEIDAFARQTGQYPGTYSIWNNFGLPGETISDGSSTAFPSQTLLNGLTARNITPVIFMQPVGSGIHLPSGADPNNPPASAKKYSNASIANGSFDAYLTKWATGAKAYNKPVILRYAHEMNQTWFPWGPYKDGKRYYNVGNSSANYVSAWRHVYNVIHPIAPKVKFFWCPWLGDFIPYYPGNNYVDYVGFDAYDSLDKNKTMQDLYDDPILKLRTMVTGSSTTQSPKPIIIGETGIDLRFPNPKRSDWITNGYSAMYNKYPDVAAIIYFNFGNWDLSGGSEIRTAYANLASQAKFQGRFPPFTAFPPPTPTPTRASTPTPTRIPTPTPTIRPSSTPTPTSTPKPTLTPTSKPIITQNPTNSPNPTPGTTLKITVGIDGIGVTSRIPLGGNKNPKNRNRTLEVKIYKASDNSLVFSGNQVFSFNSSTNRFDANIPLLSSFETGIYNLYALGNPFLTARYPGSVTITKGQEISLNSDSFNLITGDVNKTADSANKLNILDYNVIISCSVFVSDQSNCNLNLDYKKNSDLNDDGIVNQNDITLFVKEMGNQRGDILPGD